VSAPSETAGESDGAPSIAWAAAGVYAGGLLLLSVVHFAAAQRDGPLALSQVFAPHLFLPLVLVAPLGLRYAGKVVAGLLILALTVGVLRFGPGMLSLPPRQPEAGSRQVAILSWNLASGLVSPEQLTDRLLASDADLVGLQELRPVHARAIEADPLVTARYPYRALQPGSSTTGIGLLSRFPISGERTGVGPPFVSGVIDLGQDHTLHVITTHPAAPSMRLRGGLIPLRYNRSERDEALRALRAAFQPVLDAGDALAVFGDLNLTDREPAYREFTAGLSDAHRAVGLGPGSTWRPDAFSALPFGLLRIDYVLTGGLARPLTTAADCTPGAGDHCSLDALIEVRARQ
jgi:endonuclease/exonuclease/phosphatase (EEP) superfamily protein YafD